MWPTAKVRRAAAMVAIVAAGALITGCAPTATDARCQAASGAHPGGVSAKGGNPGGGNPGGVSAKGGSAGVWGGSGRQGGECGNAEGAAEPSRAGETGFNGTDVAWIQLMIAMDEQMVGLAAHVTGRLGEKIATVRKGHDAELKTLKELRRKAGMSEANPHAGHQMPGLATADDIAHADDERRMIRLLVEHFEQRIVLAQGAGSSGTHKGVKDLAQTIERASIDALASWRALSMDWVPSVHPSKEI